jgi:DNA-binding XRE family transcriptional regulator
MEKINFLPVYTLSDVSQHFMMYLSRLDKMDSLKIQVGIRLKESRLIKNMTQEQVAKKLNMTQQQYSRFENGKFELNYEQLVFLCKLYDISADYLLGLANF